VKIKMPGRRVREIRESLGINSAEFAAVLAVHPGTVHRWEGASADVTIDGIAANVLAALDKKLRTDEEKKVSKVGSEVKEALLVGGALLALGLLIAALVDGNQKK
jgi:transcriptional regulator with XRE-family HTH domain